MICCMRMRVSGAAQADLWTAAYMSRALMRELITHGRFGFGSNMMSRADVVGGLTFALPVVVGICFPTSARNLSDAAYS